MDDMQSFEQRIAAELDAMAGPEPPVDAMAVTRSVAATALWGRWPAFVRAIGFVAGAVVVAAFAGFLLFSGIFVADDDADEPIIGSSPTATTQPTASPEASATSEASPTTGPVAGLVFEPTAFDEPPRFQLTGVAESPSGAIAVSGNRLRVSRSEGLLWGSPDGGETWIRTTFDDVEWMADVQASGDGFAAIGGSIGGDRDRPAIWTSEDGLSWERRLALDRAEARALLADARGLVVLGAQRRPDGLERDDGRDPYHTVVWTSEDGDTWQSSVVSPPLSRSAEHRVEQHGLARAPDGTMVVVGTRVLDDPEEPRFLINRLLLWRSDDGETWQSVDVPQEIAHRSSNPVSLVSTPAGFLLSIAGTHPTAGELWVSADGRDWERPAEAESITLERIVTDGETLLGTRDLRGETAVFRSADGRTWDPIDVLGARGTFTAMTIAPDGRIIAAGFERRPGADPGAAFNETPFILIGEVSE